MKVATFNVNSIRVRLPLVVEWITNHQPDILALQETKVEDSLFPRSELESLGYYVSFHGMKSYNGVAVLSQKKPCKVLFGFNDPQYPEDCRFMISHFENITIVNSYVPQGTSVGSEKFDYKLKWLNKLHNYFIDHFPIVEKIIWLGDINIAPSPIDVYDHEKLYGQVGHHPDEIEALQRIINLGFTDIFRIFHKESGHYTYWDYIIKVAFPKNLGWRIDHIYATNDLKERALSCEIDRTLRAKERPSDHTIVAATFDYDLL